MTDLSRKQKIRKFKKDTVQYYLKRKKLCKSSKIKENSIMFIIKKIKKHVQYIPNKVEQIRFKMEEVIKF